LAEAAPRAEKAINLLTAMIDAERDQDASAERKALLAALADTRGPFVQGMTSIRAYLLTRDATEKEAFQEQWRDHQRAYERVRSFESLFTPKQQQHWQDFVAVRSEFEPLPTRLFALRDADDWNKAEYLLKKEAAPRGEQLKETLAQITATADARKTRSRTDMNSASIAVTVSLWLATLAAVVISAAIAVTLSRKIVSLMRILAGRASDISNGDLTGSALLVKSGDELGQLADGFDTMLANLQDLTGQILSVTENVNSAASQISSSAKQQASSTKEQASTVQEITSTMQEIAQAGSQIVEKAKEVAAVAEAAAQQSKSGINAGRWNPSVNKLRKLRKTSSRSAKRRRLSARSFQR
jgi:methyl-accepting chemotaxis protein